MNHEDRDLITDALTAARHLLGDEYQSLMDDVLREEYDEVFRLLDRAIKRIKKYG